MDKVLIVGNPNVGKSVIFSKLTGVYTTVSNYPGTTVEVSQGKVRLASGEVLVIDTPGLYSITPMTDEERVSRKMLLAHPDSLILQVVDARNLARMLPLTFQLRQEGYKLILVVNMLDEASREGYNLNLPLLSRELGVPVIGTVATRGEGLDQLKWTISSVLIGRQKYAKIYSVPFSPALEKSIAELTRLLQANYPFSPRTVATLLLRGDREFSQLVKEQENNACWQQIQKVITHSNHLFQWGAGYQLSVEEHRQAQEIKDKVTSSFSSKAWQWRDWLNMITIDPWTGIPLMLAVVYFGLYRFVGLFGAGFLVDLLDFHLFQNFLIPGSEGLVEAIIPSPWLSNLFIGEYGILTLGIRYAVAIILPIVGCFFLFFSVLEDSGYLPRLAMLMDRVCKRIGLNGRAVIPLVLGLGCDTMATMTTRILESKRERIIATFLLALAVPCSAQLGLILSLLSPYPGALLIWGSVVLFVLLLSGHLLSKIMPGNPPLFFLEIPPLRLPKLSNILVKTFSRMQWYFLEILPVFIEVSIAIWLGRLTGVFQKLLHLIEPAVVWLGLPGEMAPAFLFGFFRRDYGAAGLFDLASSGALTTRNLVVAAVTLTLFLPCVAQFAVMWKERGPWVSLLIVATILPIAFTAGYLVNMLLIAFGL